MTYSNPYTDQSFIGFFYTLLTRLWSLLTGNAVPDTLATDEIQLLVLAGVAISCAILGVFLVFRKMTMLANALSLTILLGIVAAFLWTQSHHLANAFEGVVNETALLVAALAMGLLTTFLTELLSKGFGLQEDASTGVVFTSLFALGVIAVTLLTRDAHIGLEAVMGNVDALQAHDMRLVYITVVINSISLILFYKEFAITTFDPALSRSFGIPNGFYNYLLMVLVSITAIAAFRAVGVLMVLAFFTGPPLTAKLLAKNLSQAICLAALFGIGSALLGVALARHVLTAYGVSLSTGGVCVCAIVLLYLGTLICTKWTMKTFMKSPLSS